MQTRPRWQRLHSGMRVPVHMAAISGTGRCTIWVIAGPSTPREKEERKGASLQPAPPREGFLPPGWVWAWPCPPGRHAALLLHPRL